jgi:hypothetical protein
MQNMKIYALTKATYLATAAVTGGTALTLAINNMTLIVDCSPAEASVTAAGCVAATNWANDSVLVPYGGTWMQPKETSDKVYAGIARYSKGDTLVYKGMALATGFPSEACGSGAVLTGASALVAGAAVAFGAAALAF